MLKRMLLGLGLCAFMTSLSAQLLPVQKARINGLPVYWVRTTSVPMAKVMLMFRVGAANAKLPGETWLAVNMLDQGTTAMSASEIATAVDALGAGINLNVDARFSEISLQCTSDVWKAATTLWLHLISESNFPAKAFARVKQNHLTGIALRDQSPGRVARYWFNHYLFEGQPYAHSPHGQAWAVKQLTRERIEQFYHQQFTKGQARLLVVGDVSKAQVQALAASVAAVLPSHAVRPLAPPHATIDEMTVHRVPFVSAQTHILLGEFLPVTMHDRDYLPLMMGSWILGGNGLNSVLFNTIRKQQGLAYHVYSSVNARPTHSVWVMGMQTQDVKAKQAIASLQSTVKQFIAKGPTSAQLQAAKRYWEGAYPLSFDSNGRLMMKLMRLVQLGLPLDYDDHVVANIKRLTTRGIQQAMQRYFDPNHWLLVTVGPQGNKQ